MGAGREVMLASQHWVGIGGTPASLLPVGTQVEQARGKKEQ